MTTGLDHEHSADIPMIGARIDFVSADAARFNALRDQWRDAASGSDLPKVAHKIASLLPSYVSREYGYAFPTDEQLAEIIKATSRTVGRGMNALDAAGLIERQTMMKRDQKGEAIGRLRRIFLTLPNQAGERTEVNGQPDEVNGQKRASERTAVVRIYPDRTTPDNNNILGQRRVSAYVPPRDDDPPVYRGDIEFLDAFDWIVVELTDGKTINAGEIDRIVQQAFDQTTDSCNVFMPVHWSEICALRSSDTADWFRRRTGQLIHKRAA